MGYVAAKTTEYLCNGAADVLDPEETYVGKDKSTKLCTAIGWLTGVKAAKKFKEASKEEL